jgi:hypothetical protein
MAVVRISDFDSFINIQLQSQEKVESCLWKLEALLTISTMAEGFYDISESVLRDYFSIALNLIEDASKANQVSLQELLSKEHYDIEQQNK